MKTHARYRLLFALCATLVTFAAKAQADVFNMPAGQTSLQFVAVGDPGNAADTTGYGAVNYAYEMGKYDITVAQYCQFLNSVAATDPYGLYNPDMAGADVASCGITQSGSSGTFQYAFMPGNDDFPVNLVSWGDAARFCNWIEKGQPTGSEGVGTTETGSYTLRGCQITDSAS